MEGSKQLGAKSHFSKTSFFAKIISQTVKPSNRKLILWGVNYFFSFVYTEKSKP